MTDPRFRISFEETAKGIRFNGTIELDRGTTGISTNPEDLADETKHTIGDELMWMLNDARLKAMQEGYRLAYERTPEEAKK